MRPANQNSLSEIRHERTTDSTENAKIPVEKHYSVSELATIWKLSENTIRRMFEGEPGVIRWGAAESRFRRRYTTLRIPETVVLRVHRQLRVAS